MSDELDTLTDARLSEIVAVEVAGWRRSERDATRWVRADGQYGGIGGKEPFATSFDALLPLLKGWQWGVDVRSSGECDFYLLRQFRIIAEVTAPTLPRAACIALIRAKWAEKGAGHE